MQVNSGELTFDPGSPRDDIQTDSSALKTKKEVSPNFNAAIFRRGEGWTITFGDRTESFGKCTGFFYLRAILRYPKQAVDSVMVVREAHPTDPPKRLKELEPTDDPEFTELGTSVSPKNEEFRDLRRSLSRLKREYHDAIEFKDEKAELILGEIQEVQRVLDVGSGLNQRGRSNDSARYKAASTVRMGITRARKKISSVLPELENHFLTTLRIGEFCRYEPPPEVVWMVDA